MEVAVPLLGANKSVQNAVFVHRANIKANNVAISVNTLGVILLDFGEARELEHAGAPERSGGQEGEQVAESEAVGTRMAGDLSANTAWGALLGGTGSRIGHRGREWLDIRLSLGFGEVMRIT
ncbi:hypothetical protein PM082_023613 [Marasmius tenuissimus]|nr:hypothetical protein PM082_023613 [Marasmius tenuissimus]